MTIYFASQISEIPLLDPHGRQMALRWIVDGGMREVNLVHTVDNGLLCTIFDRATSQLRSLAIDSIAPQFLNEYSLEVGERSARLLPYIHAWLLSNGETVRLLRDGERISREIISVQEDVQSASLIVPKDCPVDEYIQIISDLHPIIIPGSLKKLSFVKHVSQLDNQLEITADNAAITIVNEGSRNEQTCNPKTWYGHASICIEYIRDEQDVYLKRLENIGKYLSALDGKTLWAIGLISSYNLETKSKEDLQRIAACRLEEERSMLGQQVMMKGQLTNRGVNLKSVNFPSWQPFISGKTVTWMTTKSDISKLITHIVDQIEREYERHHLLYKSQFGRFSWSKTMRDWSFLTNSRYAVVTGKAPILLRRMLVTVSAIFQMVQLIAIDRISNSISRTPHLHPFPGPLTKVAAVLSMPIIAVLIIEWSTRHHNCATWVESLLNVIAIQLPNRSLSAQLKSVLFTTMPADLVT